jgi:hypothetical protein
MPDKFPVGTFWSDAQSIFETASHAARAGSQDCDLAILIGARGDIQMLEGAGWALPGLLAEHGAHTVYHVTRQSGRVRLEGRSGSHSCLLETESAAAAARHLLASAQLCNPPYPALLGTGAPQFAIAARVNA